MNQKENVASALGSILLGILLIVMKGKIITAAIALLAVFVLIMLVILVTCLRPKTIDMKD